MSELCYLSAFDAGCLMRQGRLSPTEYVHALISRIEQYEPVLHAFVCFTPDLALADAKRAEAEMRRGEHRGPLHGIPYGLKDLFDYEGVATTAQSRLLGGNIARADATVVHRMRAAGAIFLGKLTTHEFAIGGPSFDLPSPPAVNPWNADYFSGGSSSGSAVALAAGFLPVSLGTDTSGSVRNPAGLCSVVGMKPTRGLVSRKGVFPLSDTLDAVGPMTRNARDNAIVLDVIAGYDTGDAASVPHPVPPSLTAAADEGIEGLRVGLLRHFYTEDLQADPEVAAALDAAATVLAAVGASVREVDTLPLQEFNACNRLILLSEAYSVHKEWLRTRSAEYGALARERLSAGAECSAADYIAAMRNAKVLAEKFQGLFRDVDVVLTACSMDPPCLLRDGEAIRRTYQRQARAPFNLTGHPALTVPAGYTVQGLPMGMQLIGRPFDERTLYRVAERYEAVCHWTERHPAMQASA
jgi:aspartyl-tRNA(Asn)/glutamyl-tRNA(Gln) amidotransferase subunit A